MGSQASEPREGPSAVEPDALLRERAWLVRLAEGLLGDPAAAEDVVQEASVVALSGRPREASALRAWLAAIVRRRAADWKRGEGRRGEREARAAAREPATATDELVERAELQRVLAGGVLELPEPYRTVCLRRYFDGASAARIARESGVPAGTVRSHLARGLELLRRRLDGRGARSGSDWRPALVALVRSGPPPLPPDVRSPGEPLEPSASSAARATPWAGGGAGLLQGALAVNALKISVVVAVAAGAALAVVPRLRSSSAPTSAAPGFAPKTSRLEAQPSPLVEAGTSPPEAPAEARRVIEVPEPGPEVGAARPETAPSPARLGLRCVDPLGRPLSGASLHHARTKRTLEGAPDGRLSASFPELVSFEEQLGVRLVLRRPGFATRLLQPPLRAGERVELGDVALEDAGVVRGVVTSPGPLPEEIDVLVAGLEEDLRDPEELRRAGPRTDEATPRTRAARDGTFELTEVPVGHRRVWAHAEGHGWTASEPFEIEASGALAHGVRIALVPLRGDDRIAGRVLDPDGQPLAGLHVRGWGLSSSRSTSPGAVTGVGGRFELLLEHRVPHGLTVRDPGNRWSPVVLEDVEPGRTDVEVRFRETREIDVVVVDHEGEPVDGWHLRTTVYFPGLRTTLCEARSEPGGRGSLLLPNRVFDLELESRGHASLERKALDPDGLGSELVLELEALPGIHGVVRDPGGEPVAGARVELSRLAYEGELIHVDGLRTLVRPRSTDETRSDEEGRFTVYASEAGPYVVRVESRGFAPLETVRLDVQPRERLDLEAALDEGGAIEGRVLLPPGEDPKGRVVVLDRADAHPRSVRLGDTGDFGADLLTPGPWRVLLRDEAPSTSFVSYSGTDELPPIEWDCEVGRGEITVHDLDLRDGRPCLLRGLVEGPEVAGWTVSLEDSSRDFVTPEVVATTRIEADGTFAVAAREPGAYAVVVSGPEGAGGSLRCRETVELARGERDWRWSFEPARLVLEGVDAAEGAERVLRLTFPTPPGSGEREVTLRVLGEGRVVLPVVPAGRCLVERFDPHVAVGSSRPRFETLREARLVAGEETILPIP